MLRWLRLPLILCVLLLAGIALAGTPPVALPTAPAGIFSEELDTDLYDCTLALTPAKKLADAGTVTVLLEWGVAKDYTRIAISKQFLTVEAIRKNQSTLKGKVESGVKAGTPYRLTILRRGTWLGVVADNALVFRGEVPRPAGAQAGFTAGPGWTVDDAQIQRLQPVVYADNFMRTADENHDWVVQRGDWALQSAWDNDPHGNSGRFANVMFAQNPFAWVGTNPAGSAFCTIGKPFWEDYTFTTAVCPSAQSAVGVAVNLADAQNGYLIRWTPVDDSRAQGNRLILYKLVKGQGKWVAESRGGYIPGQWYTLSIVSSLEGLRILIDGHERLVQKDVSPWRGGVGLYAEGKTGAIFDDVSIYGRTLNTDLIREKKLSEVNRRFQDDRNGMQEWATTKSDWVTAPGIPLLHLYHGNLYGDQWMSLSFTPKAPLNGQLTMVLNGDGLQRDTGYRAVMKIMADTRKPTYTLFRDAAVLATATGEALQTGTEYSARFQHVGNRLTLSVDGTPVVSATETQAPLAGVRPAYAAEGCLSGITPTDVLVLGRNMLDYTFADAPTDWLGEGTWLPTVRWACAPTWSFLAGWSQGDAVLWHKQRLVGDQEFQAFVGVKMEYPRERDVYDNRYRNLAMTICGDGHDPRSGYAGIYGAPAEDGTPNRRAVLLRNGVEVAAANAIVPGRGQSHRHWFDLEMRKHGRTVEFWVEGYRLLRYDDPEPLTGGVPAVWTSDNGISLARVRLHFANPPQARTDVQVTLDAPWYPEWGNLRQPMPLEFPSTWSSSGQSTQLEVTPREVPAGEETAVTLTANRAVFTPKVAGFHWYALSATDGTARSPKFHLSLPVFSPALGRDDDHAVVLYRFTEGKGETINDYSRGKREPAPLTIAPTAKVQWLPGQGLLYRGGAPLSSKGPVDKLMALKEAQAATVEVWVSGDTMYPPNGWAGCILAWQQGATRNFALGQHSSSLIFAPRGATLANNDANACISNGGYRTGLQHLVVTWNGTTTTSYSNGRLLTSVNRPWNPAEWVPAPLTLGIHPAGATAEPERLFLGTYYLVAIHETCFTNEQVLRHYNAGPSAR